jgi:hypothetical protein
LKKEIEATKFMSKKVCGLKESNERNLESKKRDTKKRVTKKQEKHSLEKTRHGFLKATKLLKPHS